MVENVLPGDFVWVAPDTSLYDTPDVFEQVDDTIRISIGWSLALVLWARGDGWTLVLHNDVAVFVGTRCLMSINETPSTISDR